MELKYAAVPIIIAALTVAALPTYAQEPTNPPIATNVPTATPTPIPPTPQFAGVDGQEEGFTYDPDPGTYNWAVPQMPALASPTPYGAGSDTSPVEDAAANLLDGYTADADGFIADMEAIAGQSPAGEDGEGPGSVSGDGIPSDLNAVPPEFLDNLVFFFAVLKAINPAQFGKIGELLRAVIILFVLIFGRKIRFVIQFAIMSAINWVIRLILTIFKLIRG